MKLARTIRFRIRGYQRERERSTLVAPPSVARLEAS